MSYFENVAPERVDIKGNAVPDFLTAVATNGLELHSLKVIRHGKCIASTWFAPYGPELLHPIYSFSKSFTAAAIGFARQEGILSLDEKIVDLFPEECPEDVNEHLKNSTIHDLLCMGCGHDQEICDIECPTWITDFMHQPFVHKPGTHFEYNTAGTNILSAIITKKTGLSLMEYLEPRLFEPLGIKDIECYVQPDELHTSHGGGGMRTTTENMARFAYFMLNDGVWEGKPLLKNWYELAAVKQIDTKPDADSEWKNGYGYQCWMGSRPGSFRADGAFGQFGFVFPDLDLIVVMTSATEQTQTLIDCMYEHIIANTMPDGTLSDAMTEDTTTDLSNLLSNQKLPALSGSRNPFYEAIFSEKPFVAMESDIKMNSFETLIGGCGKFDLPNDTAISQMSFAFDETSVTWTVVDGGIEKSITAAMNNRFEICEDHGQTYAATARWRGLNALEMEIRPLIALSGVRIIFRLDGDMLHLEADDTLITVGGLGMYEKTLVDFIR
ncbi:MAG: beta-lactamase family protein [Lachnospiraceae bacterium]|nr:beta-lactamase family protein [Lachnospiraceae bacterium]